MSPERLAHLAYHGVQLELRKTLILVSRTGESQCVHLPLLALVRDNEGQYPCSPFAMGATLGGMRTISFCVYRVWRQQAIRAPGPRACLCVPGALPGHLQ